MKVIKVSSQGQITIPKRLRHLCKNGSFSLYTEENKIILRPIEINVAKTESEFLEELMKKATEQ